MRSSSGAYYVNLDHLRALAAFIVFQWHFIHSKAVPLDHAPDYLAFPLAIFDQGHCGVALFMALSGYLFAKLLDGKRICYWRFVWNRFIRLIPLLLVVVVAYGVVEGVDTVTYTKRILWGAVLPTLPNGGWSITAEAHFYILLPLILFLLRVRIGLVWLLLIAAIAVRTGIYLRQGQVQYLSFWTIIGRIDQFILGILAFCLSSHLKGRHGSMLMGFVAFAAFYWAFAASGGWYGTQRSPMWIIMPTIEGAFFASLIAYYDTSFSLEETGMSGVFAKIGTYSYSIYLLHFFFVFRAGEYYFDLVRTDNFYLALGAGTACFLPMILIAKLSFHFIEEPFLRLRTRYVRLQKSR